MDNSQKYIGAFRELLVGIGAVLVAFLPSAEGYWNEATGVALAVAALVWAIKNKQFTQDQILTTIRKVITFVGIIFAAKIPADLLAGISTVAAFLLPVIWQWVEKKK